jgi:uncharacterized cysteine cluster protein YcgN (CxxCxxCC family)
MNPVTKPFWESKQLADFTREEWESLCDGCGRCCLVKLEDEDTGELFYTNVACQLLDMETCRCIAYERRTEEIPGCLVLSYQDLETIDMMPPTCAYRRMKEGRPLAAWHPLVSGDSDSVHAAGISVRGKVVPEQYIHPRQLEDHIVEWPEQDD